MRKVCKRERLLNEGSDLTEVLRHLEIAESTWNRWLSQLHVAVPVTVTEPLAPTGATADASAKLICSGGLVKWPGFNDRDVVAVGDRLGSGAAASTQAFGYTVNRSVSHIDHSSEDKGGAERAGLISGDDCGAAEVAVGC